MGRPLNKKYFGNRNLGTGGEDINGGLSNSQNYGDDHIGGEGLASITWSQRGSFRGNDAVHNPLVGMALPAPTIPGGVQATWTVLLEVESVTTGAGSVGLVVGDTYTYAGLGSPVFTVATSTNNGTNATFTVTNRGSVDLADLPGDTQTVSMTKVTGTGAATFVVDINFRVKSTTIVEKGSGYTGAETFTVTLYAGGTGTAPAGTIVLTTDTGAVGSATNQENAILMTARLTGGSATTVDIIRQVSAHRYKVTDGTRTGIVKLKSSVATAAGEGSIRLLDTDGGTYFATKLTSRKAVITRGTGSQAAFVTGTSVKWNMTAATADSLKIDNA